MRALSSSLLLILSILISVYSPTLGSASSLQAKKDMRVVWAADKGSGEQIYFSSVQNGDWSIPVQVSNYRVHHFQPAVATGGDGKNWLVWSRKEGHGSSLQYSVLTSAQISQAIRIPTGLNSNSAAAIVVDTNNIPVIAWEGSDKLYPDIYWSSWNGENWSPVQKVHDDNNVPDLNPSLQCNANGKIILSWQTFTEGKYVEISKTLEDGKWVSFSEVIADNPAQPIMKNPFPPFIEDQRKATLFIRDDNGSRSIRPSR